MMIRKSFVPLACVVLSMASCGPKAVDDGHFLIEGTLTGMPDSVEVYMAADDGQNVRFLAFDTVIDGRFSFTDTITAKRKMTIGSRTPGYLGADLPVWVAPGEHVVITGSGSSVISEWNVGSSLPEQVDERLYFEAQCPELITLAQLQNEEQDMIYDMFSVHRGDGAYVASMWPKIDSIRNIEEPLYDAVDAKSLAYLKSAPITPTWLDAFSGHAAKMVYARESPLLPLIKEIYGRMSDADKATPAGRVIVEYMNVGELVDVGDDMADGDLYDIDGNLHHLSELKGRYIMLDFWGAGCGPCINSIPEIEEVAAAYADKLAVVSLSLDSPDVWKKTVADRNLTGLQWNEMRASGRTGLAARYRMTGIPHYAMISPEGKIIDIWSGYGPGSIKSRLDTLLK